MMNVGCSGAVMVVAVCMGMLLLLWEFPAGASEVAARVPNGNSYSVTHWKSSSGLHIRE